MAERCPFCDDYESETLAGLCNHVRQKHDIKEYQARGMSVKEIVAAKRKANEVAAAVSEPQKTEPSVTERCAIKIMQEPKKVIVRRLAKSSEPERPDRLPKGQRKLFSEQYPNAYSLAASILPRTELLVLAIVLIWSAFTNMAAGNYLFVMDWFEMTIIGPIILGIFTYPGGPGEWFQVYGVIATMITAIIVVLLIVFYMTVWRYLFKDYSIVRGQTELKEGRVYWWTGNIWTRMWDRFWRSPPRTEHVLYIKQYFWPPLNPLNPRARLIKLHLSKEEEVEADSMFSLRGHERRYRIYIGDNEMATTDDAQRGREIPLNEITEVFRDRRERLITDTQKFSMANPHVRLDLLRDGTYLIPEDFDERPTPEKTG